MTDSQKWMLIAGVVLGGWLFYLLSPVFTPFLVSALLAYLGDPVVDRLEKLKLSRTLSVTIVFIGMVLLMIAVVLLLIPLIEHQVSYLVRKMPEYSQWFKTTVLPWLQQTFNIDTSAIDLAAIQKALAKHWQQAGGLAAQMIASITGSGLAILGFLANLVLIPVVTFYLLRDWDHLVAGIRDLLPRQSEKKISMITRESDEVLGAFLKGQFLVMLSLGLVYSVGLWIAGLELAWLIGMISGLVSFVPYLGFIIGVLAAGIAVLVQTHELLQLLPVLAVFGVGQLLESFVFTPWFVGNKIGLHPVTVIFAVMAGGQLFGFVGILLALPLAAVLAVIVRHLRQHYVDSKVYDRANP
jgi:predicted PurR-regulated permease PerM